MKEITLKFREVAVDGVPDESMDCAVVWLSETKAYPNNYYYSKEFDLFNVHTNPGTAICVDYWMPLDEFNAAFKEDAQDVQTLD